MFCCVAQAGTQEMSTWRTQASFVCVCLELAINEMRPWFRFNKYKKNTCAGPCSNLIKFVCRVVQIDLYKPEYLPPPTNFPQNELLEAY